MFAIGILIVLAALVLWAIASYTHLVGRRNEVLNGWRQIDVQLKRRHDLIPNLVNAVRGSMDFERETLTAVRGNGCASQGARRHRAGRRGPEGGTALAGPRPSVRPRGKLSDAQVERQ